MLGRGPGSPQVPPRVLPRTKPPVAESAPSSSSPPSSCRPRPGPCTWFSSSVLACVFHPPSECRDPMPHSDQPKPGHLPRCLFPPLPRYGAARSHGAEDRLTFSNTRPSLPGAAVTAGLRRQCDLSRLEAEVRQQVWAELRRLWERVLPASCSSWGSRRPGWWPRRSCLYSVVTWPPVCPSLLFLEGHQSCQIRAHLVALSSFDYIRKDPISN